MLLPMLAFVGEILAAMTSVMVAVAPVVVVVSRKACACSYASQILSATNIVSYQGGIDPVDLSVMAEMGEISEHQRMQLESMLAAAKGFAAATTNMIDVLREVPNQTDEETVQLRVADSTRSADNALTQFMKAAQSIDTQPTVSKQKADAAFEEEAFAVADATESELLSSCNRRWRPMWTTCSRRRS